VLAVAELAGQWHWTGGLGFGGMVDRVFVAAFQGGTLSEWLVKLEAVAPIASVAFR